MWRGGFAFLATAAMQCRMVFRLADPLLYIVQSVVESDREAIVLALCRRSFQKRVIVFFPTKAMCHRMKVGG